ncbi:unnamed protein product [Larinioides sclopetarius]|uniref:Uncharacterized protein n=1 Tax=Larinioides sclopetarius TaxID=280406 RepID=A0AAV1ZF30_9ARAC
MRYKKDQNLHLSVQCLYKLQYVYHFMLGRSLWDICWLSKLSQIQFRIGVYLSKERQYFHDVILCQFIGDVEGY